jgi:hypothetical protein
MDVEFMEMFSYINTIMYGFFVFVLFINIATLINFQIIESILNSWYKLQLEVLYYCLYLDVYIYTYEEY